MKKGILCALALPLAAGAVAAIGANSKNVPQVKAEVGDMPAYTEKVVSISAARTRMPAANTPTRVGIEFQALGTDWVGGYLAVVDAGYPKLASTFNMKDYILIDGQAYTFWNNQDFRAIVQDGWMEPCFKITDMASKTGMVVTLKKGLKLPSRQYITNLNAGLGGDTTSWETPAEVYTLDANYTITFKAISDYTTELNKAGGSPMSVEKIEVDHTEIAKTGDRYWLQSVNPTTLASNRFSFNICVDANTTNDFPSGVVVNGNYYTNGDGNAITGLAQAPSGLNSDFMLKRAKSLNLLNGNVSLDGEPITYLYDTDGQRNSSGYGAVSFFDTTKGRIVMNKNSDNRVRVTFDVIVPDFAAKRHRLMIKKGTEFPSWSYIMGTKLGNTPSNGVYVTQKDLVWDLEFTSSGACTIYPIAQSDDLPTPTKVDSFGLVDRLKFDVNGGDAFRIWFNPISEYNRCTDGNDPHGYYANRNQDQNIHYGEASEYSTRGNVNQLHVWDNILINGQPAKNSYRDSRLHVMGVSSSNVGFQDGQVYGSFWFEILESKAISGTGDDTLSIKFLKGMQLPTQESALGSTKAEYLELDQDTEFILEHKQGEAKTAWTVKEVIRENGEFNTVATSIKQMRLTAGDQGDSRALFDLTNYDYEGGFNQFNCGSLILGGEYNIIDNSLINSGDDSTPSIPASSLGYANNRYFRVPVDKGAVGYNMGTSPTAPSFNQITIKAGTRFPAYSYLSNGAETVDVNCTPKKVNEKFYETEEDVTLFHVGNGVFKTIEDIRTAALEDLSAAFTRDDYREAEQAIFDEEIAKINAATSKISVDAALASAKTKIGALKTDADYVAEELAAAKTAAKAELNSYLNMANYTMGADTIATLISAGEAAIDACETIDAIPAVLAAEKAKLDAVSNDQSYANALLETIAALPQPALSNAFLNALTSAMIQVSALTPECAALVGETELAKVSAAFAGFKALLVEDVEAAISDAQQYSVYTEEQRQAIIECLSTNKPLIESATTPGAAVEAYNAAYEVKEDTDYSLASAYINEVVTFFSEHVVEGELVYELTDRDAIMGLVTKYNTLAADGNVAYYLANMKIRMGSSQLTVAQLLNNYIIGPYYQVVEEETLRIEDVIDAIPMVITLDDEEVITEARAELDACTNEDVLDWLEEDGYIEKVEAAEEILAGLKLAERKETAVTEITSYFNAEDYRDAEKATLEQLVVNVTASINEATSLEEVNALVAQAKADIDAVKTDAQYVAEELAAAQVAAKAELEEYAAAKDASKYDEAGNKAIADAVAAGKLAIDEAASQEAVASALETAKAAVDAVEEYVAPQPEKKGCGSSVVAASAIITLVSLLGAGLISAKKKQD